MYSKILLNILIVIVVTVAIILLTNLLWQWQTTKSRLATDNRNHISLPVIDQQPPAIDEEMPPVPPIPEPSNYSRFAGVISEISDASLTISTVFGEKIINFDDSTVWQKIYLNKFPPLPGSTEIIELPPAENLDLSDLSAGQEIEVASNNNIRGRNQFVAAEINLLERVN